MRRRVGVMMVAVLSSLGLAAARAQAGVPQQEGPWYTATRVAEKVWRIDDHGSDNIYLVEGTKQALLVDTGLGVANLADFVRTLTSLPVTVVNTHGHPDHAGGNGFFATVYAHPADFEAATSTSTVESHRKVVERMAKGAAAQDDGYRAPATLLPLKDGQVFDLGGRALEVVEQPGHTPGEIVLVDKANRLVIAGDSNNTLVWLFLANSRPLDVYLSSLKKLQARSAEFDTILPGHGGPLRTSHLDEQIACVEDILSGRCTGEPYKSFVGTSRACTHGGATVTFDPKNLRSTK